MDSFCFKKEQQIKKNSVSKIRVACSNTNHLTSSSLLYEPWHIGNPDIFIIRVKSRILEYSYIPVHKSLSNILQCFSEAVLSYNQFLLYVPSQIILDVWQDPKYAYVPMSATQLAQLFQVLLQACSDIFNHYSRAYSRIFRTFCILGIFKTLAYFYHKTYSGSTVYS